MDTAIKEVVFFNTNLIKAIKDHSKREADKGNYEAVGFLVRAKETNVITSFVALNNHAAKPDQSFFVEPWEQFRAERKIHNGGYEIAGVYHSHPTSEALPSRTDSTMARPGELMLIYSVAFDTIRAWREAEGSLEPVEVKYA